MKRIIMLLGAGMLMLCSMVFAAVPQLINFQGILKDGSGNPVANGSYSVQFTIYDAAAGGNIKWQETQSVTTSSGLFTVLLGSSTPVSDSAFNNPDRYLGVKVGADPEMTPRQRLSSVGYSYNSSEWTSAGQNLFRLSGNVGIGTASPAAQLQVHDASGTINGARLMLTQTSTGTTIFDGAALICGAPNRAFWWNYENGPSIFGTSNQERMRIDSTGNVGIGTPTPQTRLHVNGGMRWGGATTAPYARSDIDAGGLFMEQFGTSVTDENIRLQSSMSGDINNYLQFIISPSNGFSFAKTGTANGNVGIGITGPTFAKLYVEGDLTNTAGAIVGHTSRSNSTGIQGIAHVGTGAIGVFGSSSQGRAGYFNGSVEVTGNLTKGGGAFKIDHPTDPANKCLYHSFVESPDMKNIYDGVVTTDAKGNAVVNLPEWFGALNKDFRYQLTVIGEFAQAIISQEVANNQFSIKTNQPNVKVSWQVTGIRQDAYANAHRIPVEESKSDKERGYYLHPELFGQPEEKQIDWAHNPEMMKEMKERKPKGEKEQK